MRRTIGVGLALVLVAFGCGGETAVDEVGIGDCFDDPGLQIVTDLELIDCMEPHDNEVFAALFMSESIFPGEDEASDFAADACLEYFEPYVGESYAVSPLDYFSLYPTAESWANGDRRVLCVLYSADMEKLVGPRRADASN